MSVDHIIYISGPMNGIPNFNYPEFNRVANMLRNLGFGVVNPAELDVAIKHDGNWNVDPVQRRDLLDRDLELLEECTAIFMLEGSDKSSGALEELAKAKALGLRVWFDRPGVFEQLEELADSVAFDELECISAEDCDVSEIIGKEYVVPDGRYANPYGNKDDKPVKTDKRQWWIVPLSLFGPVIDVFANANKKYRRCSWMDCEPDRVTEKYYCALMRHIEAWADGEWDDPESGHPHLAHAAANLLILLWHRAKF